jgi:hypothetical protein
VPNPAGEQRLPPALIYRNTGERPGAGDILNDNPMRWLMPLLLVMLAGFGAVAYVLVTAPP